MRPILATSASPRRAKLLGRRGTAMALDSQGWRIAHNPNSVVTDCDRRPVLRAMRSLRPQMFRDGQMKPSSPRRFLEPGGAVLDRACRVLHGAAFASDSGVSETCCKNLAKRAVLPCTGIAGVQGRFNSVQLSIREWKGVLDATLAQNPLDRRRAGCSGDHRGPRRRVWRRWWRWRLLAGSASRLGRGQRSGSAGPSRLRDGSPRRGQRHRAYVDVPEVASTHDRRMLRVAPHFSLERARRRSRAPGRERLAPEQRP
jgi:hypothetical protein